MAEGPVAPQQDDVAALMLQEAQAEMGKLRAELYSVRRLAEERRQALDGLARARDQLQAEQAAMQGRIASLQSEVLSLRAVQQQHAELSEMHARLAKEAQLHLQARRILETELQEERAARSAAEEAKARVEGERARLVASRDEAATQLRLATAKAAEAEEEQCRAEDEAAGLRQELAALQAKLADADDSMDGQRAGASNLGGIGTAKQGTGSDEEVVRLSGQLEQERARAASLLESLSSARAESEQAQANAARWQAECSDARETLGGEVSEQRRRVSELQQALTAAQAAAASGSGEGAAAAAVAGLQRQLTRAEAVADTLQHRVRDLETELATANAAVATAQAAAAAANTAAANAAAAAANVPTPASGREELSPFERVSADAVAAAEEEVALLQETLELLMHKVVGLRKSRDKLLAQLDRQSLEMEQLVLENRVLADEVCEVRDTATRWELQVQEGLVTIDRLKDLLEESASWQPGQEQQQHQKQQQQRQEQQDGDVSAVQGQPHGSHDASTADGDPSFGVESASGDGHQTSPVSSNPAVLHRKLMAERIHAAQLDLQVQALCAELLRAHDAKRELGRSMVPALNGIENRLVQLRSDTVRVR